MTASNSRRQKAEVGTKGPVALFDPLASEYDKWFEEDGRLVFEIERQSLLTITPLLPKPWIEIGVGSGRFAQALGIDLGLDPSIKLLHIARKRKVDVLLGKGELQPFRDGVFGTVFLIVTFCFLNSPAEVLLQIHRALKKDGMIVLGLVLQESPWGQFYQTKKAEGHRFYRHATFYSLDEATTLLKQGGFVTNKVVSTLFQSPGAVETTEMPRDNYNPSAGFTVITARKY